MTLNIQPELLQAWCLCAVILFFKTFANSMLQAFGRIKNKQFVNPEDARQFAGKGTPAAQAPHPLVARAAACWRNDLENIPFFLLFGLGAVFLMGEGDVLLMQVCMGVFVVARIAHTIFYMNAMQPWRFLSFSLGYTATSVIAIWVAMAALKL